MKSVLIVDDHPMVRHALKAQLAGMLPRDATILEADNATNALGVLHANNVDLVLLDLDLPGISGLELITRIRSSSSDTGILVISSFENSSYAGRCLAKGANGFLNKRESLQELSRAVNAVLDGYAFFTAETFANHCVERNEILLSDRESAILKFLSNGKSNNDISEYLFISNKTVSTYKMRIMKKLKANSLVEMIDIARRKNLL